jgi:hypothetical protein
VLVCCSTGLQQAAAVRKAEAIASPLLAYPWMPWKNENGVWQKASDPNPDFTKMTLQDLPAPELYLQVSSPCIGFFLSCQHMFIMVLSAAHLPSRPCGTTAWKQQNDVTFSRTVAFMGTTCGQISAGMNACAYLLHSITMASIHASRLFCLLFNATLSAWIEAHC